jgi:hypothetical protein
MMIKINLTKKMINLWQKAYLDIEKHEIKDSAQVLQEDTLMKLFRYSLMLFKIETKNNNN